MTFYGDEIGDRATLNQVEVYVAEKSLFCEPQDAYNYWEKRKWKTRKGTIVKSLEAAINVYNGLAIKQYTKKKAQSKTKKQTQDERKAIQKKAVKLICQNKKKKPYERYEKQLKDDKWKAFRWFVMRVRGEKCEICGCETNLQIHHLHYKKNAKAWEYTCNDVIVVCRECHKRLHKIND